MATPSNAADLVRAARARAGLSQAVLGERAGVAQSVVSAYESGAREPSLAMLRKLVSAAGMELDISVRRPRKRRFPGPVGRKVDANREALLEILERHRVGDPRVFGSVARGDDRVDSDLDLLVDLPGGVGLLSLGSIEAELEGVLGSRVDLIPARDLKQRVRETIESELVPL
ncbi:helix-turn-helix domain-containing protein [Intrasporangium sp.]|uniref:helix-turn-helix domain-containing protein n=1 Tax=Intrasporangium sp. TaxID=1925024 RepID=UPI0033658567